MLELSQLVPHLHCRVTTVVVFECQAYPADVGETVRESAHGRTYCPRHPWGLHIPCGCPCVKRYVQSGSQHRNAKLMLHFVADRSHNRWTA